MTDETRQTLREEAARIAYRKQWGVPYRGQSILTDAGAGACNAVGTVDDILALLTADEAVERRLVLFLEILAAAGGEANASDSKWNWINAFCEEHEGRDPDTFNLAIERGYTRSTHDSDTDNATVWLTDKGRAALTAAQGEQP